MADAGPDHETSTTAAFAPSADIDNRFAVPAFRRSATGMGVIRNPDRTISAGLSAMAKLARMVPGLRSEGSGGPRACRVSPRINVSLTHECPARSARNDQYKNR